MAKKPTSKKTGTPRTSTVDAQLAKQEQTSTAATVAGSVLASEIVIRAIGGFVRRSVEKGVIGRTHDRETAKDIVENRSVLHAAAAYGATRIATRSLPGALVVGGGLLVKTLYDRGKNRKASGRSRRKTAKKTDPSAAE